MATVQHHQHQGRVELWGEWLASRRPGQFVFMGVDSVLRLVEKTLMWSSQQAPSSTSSSACEGEAAECGGKAVNGKAAVGPSLVVVSRPVSWPLFLPLLGILGVVRVTVYCVSRIIRKPCDTIDMIHWLQTRRRKLRAIKLAGLRNLRKETEVKPSRTPNGTPNGKPLQSTTPEAERKRKYEDVEQSDFTDGSDDESFAVKLEKCTEDYDSEEDPDFEPNSDDDSSEDEEASGESDDETEESAVLVEAPSSPSPASVNPVPSIVTVESPESVSDYGSASAESPGSIGSSVMSAPLSPKSKFLKFFRPSSKTKQQL